MHEESAINEPPVSIPGDTSSTMSSSNPNPSFGVPLPTPDAVGLEQDPDFILVRKIVLEASAEEDVDGAQSSNTEEETLQ